MVGHAQKRAVATLLVALLVLVPPASGPALAATDGPGAPFGGAAPQVTPGNESTNATVHHENPDEVSAFGNLEQVRSWLSKALVDRLSQSTIQLQQGEYERARGLLGDRYNDRLGQFVDVIGETATDGDDGNDDAYRDVQRSQRNYTSAVREYEQTYDEYERAVENGNETRARRLGRELDDQATRVRQLNRTVVDDYGTLANQTGLDLSTPTQRVASVSENVSARQSEVETTLFTETDLQGTPNEATISYRDPLEFRGRLLTADDEPLADRTITVEVAGRERTVRTDADGAFELTYRPRTVSTSRTELDVTYRPRPDSEYRGSNETVAVTIEQVTASLSASVEPGSVAYGDSVSVNASLRVDGQPVSGVPVRASTDGLALGSGRTASAGTVELGRALPATVPPGERTLTVAAGNATTAVTAPDETVALTVVETGTTLSVERNSASATAVTLGGRLATVDGTPASDQPVTVTLANGTTRSTETGPNGTYAVTVDPDGLDPGNDGTVLVTARYDGTGRNLNGSTAQRRLDVTAAGATGDGSDGDGTDGDGDGTDGEGDGGPGLAGGLVVAGLLVVLVGLVVARRSLSAGDDAEAEDDGSEVEAATGDHASDGADDPSGGATGDELDLAPGRSFLEAGDETAALKYTYQHLRGHVAGTFGAGRADTHWEFFDACRDGGMDDARLDALRSLVEAYETATFGQGSIPVDDLESVLATVEARWTTDPDPAAD